MRCCHLGLLLFLWFAFFFRPFLQPRGQISMFSVSFVSAKGIGIINHTMYDMISKESIDGSVPISTHGSQCPGTVFQYGALRSYIRLLPSSPLFPIFTSTSSYGFTARRRIISTERMKRCQGIGLRGLIVTRLPVCREQVYR